MQLVASSGLSFTVTKNKILRNDWHGFADVPRIMTEGLERIRKYSPGMSANEFAQEVKLSIMRSVGTSGVILRHGGVMLRNYDPEKAAFICRKIDAWLKEGESDKKLAQALERLQPILNAFADSELVAPGTERRYTWNDTPSLYGFMVDIVSFALELRDPGDKLPWRLFSMVFVNGEQMVTTAKKTIGNYRRNETDLPRGHRLITHTLKQKGLGGAVEEYEDDLSDRRDKKDGLQ